MLQFIISLLFVPFMTVFCCKSTPTTTPDPDDMYTVSAPFTFSFYTRVNKLGYYEYPHCPSYFVGCTVTTIDWNRLEIYSKIELVLPTGGYAGLKRDRIHKLGDTYMAYYFVDDYEKYYDEAVFLYDGKNMRAAISWHEADDKYFRFIIWMPEPGMIVISETGPSISTIAPGISFTASGGNYGFRASDDAMTWFFRSTQNLPEKYVQLWEKGRRDNDTVVTVSVAIKYTVEFAQTLGIFQKYGLYFLTAYTLKVLNEVFHESQTLIKFKLQCVSHVLVAEDNVETGDDDLKLETVLGHKSTYEKLSKRLRD